jgi:hypothetical protein
MTHNLHYRPHFLLFQFALPFMSILWGMLTLYSYMCMIAHLHTILCQPLPVHPAPVSTFVCPPSPCVNLCLSTQPLCQPLSVHPATVSTFACPPSHCVNLCLSTQWVDRQRLTQWLGGQTKVDTVTGWTDKG